MYRFPELTACRTLKRIAILTSGGDAPGMNAAIRAVVRRAGTLGIEVYGIYRGYSGLLSGDFRRLRPTTVANILQRGGTMLKSDRCEAFHQPQVREQAATRLRDAGIDALVVIGGDGSLTGAHLLGTENGLPVVGLPGTIDNDIPGTDDTIGFDTAVTTALDSIDRIRDTAMSHERLFLVEVMGRNSGFIAVQTGIAGGAEMVLVPESDISADQVCQSLEASRAGGKVSSHIIVVAEGAQPGRTQALAGELESCGYEPRVCILGHTQRGGSPTGHDRLLASSLGAMAVEYLLAGAQDVMLGIQDGGIVAVPLEHVISEQKTLDKRLLELVSQLQR